MPSRDTGNALEGGTIDRENSRDNCRRQGRMFLVHLTAGVRGLLYSLACGAATFLIARACGEDMAIFRPLSVVISLIYALIIIPIGYITMPTIFDARSTPRWKRRTRMIYRLMIIILTATLAMGLVMLFRKF